MFHYTSSGLRNIWLANGYHARKTAYGSALSIDNVEGLHRAIAMRLVNSKPRLTGAEFRFLRKDLDLSQAKLASLFGNDAQTVALWEKTGRVPKWADRMIRLVYQEYTEGNAKIVALVGRLSNLDKAEYGKKWLFEDTRRGWQPKAA